MDVTIRQVLQSDVISRSRPHVLGGTGQLDDVVHGVHMAESADLVGLLEGGELILSSGIVLDDSAERTGAFLRGLQHAGASGVALSFLSRSADSKEALRQAARTVDLPVVLLDDRARFIDILDSVRGMVRESAPTPIDAASVTELLSSSAVRQLDPGELISALATALRRPVVVEDARGRVVQHVGLSPDAMAEYVARLTNGPSHLRETRLTGDGPWRSFPITGDAGSLGKLLSPLGAEAAPIAAAMADAGRLLGAGMAARDLTMATCRRASRTQLLDAVRTGRGTTARTARLDAELLGITAAEQFVIAVLGLPGGGSSIETRAVLDAAVLAAEAVCDATLTLPLPSEDLPAIGIVMGIRAGEDPHEPLAALQENLLRTPASGSRWRIGTSTPARTLGDAARRGLDEAYHVAHSALSVPASTSRIFHAKDLGFRWLARSLVETEESARYVRDHLGPFVEEPELLTVLDAYLRTSGNITELARTVHLSRPSVYSRLSRITEDMGVDLSDADVRLSMHVALILHELTVRTGDNAPS